MKNTVTFLFKTFLLVFLSVAIDHKANAQPPANQVQQAGYYKMNIGNIEIVALSDGTIRLDMGQLLIPTKPGEVETLLKQNFLENNVETSITVYLVRAGGKLILLDAGCGSLMGPTVGLLTTSLRNAGFRPEQIDAVMISHLHLDHVGGLINNGKMTFPNATVYVNEAETTYWLSEENARKAPESAKVYFQAAQSSIGPYRKAGKLKTFQSGELLLSAIKAVSTAGHSAGHTSFELNSSDQKIVFWGDLVHAGPVQFADPEVTIQFDSDTKEAAAARKQAFADAAKSGYIVAAAHVSFPGIGHLRATNGTFQWIPINYSTLVAK